MFDLKRPYVSNGIAELIFTSFNILLMIRIIISWRLDFLD